ncbi:MAG: hypothetical protein DRQ64_00340 [Gammaproteobacteria bacterium]|nr:MAG: hypothetical protein DRQ64_00340 [Gammaproteobacteria bacterium]
MAEPKPLIPPDPDHCQAEKPNGHTFMTFGGSPGLVECRDPPSAIVFEVGVGKDGRRGAMSLCGPCFDVFIKDVGLLNMHVFHKAPKVEI